MTRARPSRGLVLVVMCVGYFLVLLDVTVVNVALPQLGAELDAGLAGLQWVVDGYAVALATLLLLGGSLGDVVGHRPVVLTGLAVFGVASLACGLAPVTGLLVAVRVLQGVGAALLLPGTLAVVADTFPGRREQARAIGVWAAVGSAALPAGPLLGGALVEGLSWRAVFLVNVPIVVVAGVVAARVVPPRPAARRARRPDWLGALLGALTLGLAVLAVVAGLWPAALVAVLALAAFVVVDRRTPDPVLPLDLFRSRAFTSANAVAGVMNLGTLGCLFLVTLFLQRVQGRSPLEAGVALLPLFLPLSLLATYAGRLTARRGPRLPMTVGLLIAAAGVGLLATATSGSAYVGLLPSMLLWGTGVGLLTPAVVAAAVSAVEPVRSGLASGINNTARQAGGAIGIAAYGALAGSPDRAPAFVSGLHTAGIVTAGLYVAAALVVVRAH